MLGQLKQRLRNETFQVVVLTAGLLGIAVLLGRSVAGGHVAGDRAVSLPWWFFIVAFAVTEAVVMHIQVRREAQTVSVSELPLVLGLFFAGPLVLLLGRLVGSVLTFALYRRSSLLKTSFNAALVVAETCVALWVFDVFGPDGLAIGPREWAAAYAAALVANAFGIVAIGMVIGVYEGHQPPWRLAREAVVGQTAAPLVTTLALVAVTSLAQNPRSGWLLVAAAIVLLIAYRGYASLADRHLNLERLYHFSQAVSRSPENDNVLQCVLEEAKTLLASGYAEMVFLNPEQDGVGVRVTLGPDGRMQRSESRLDELDGWLLDLTIQDGDSLVLPRNTRDPRSRDWLTAHGLRDAIAVPLRGSAGTIGMLLIADRLGEVRTFDDEDVLLVETLANHASVALQKGELIDQLQHDALHDALTHLPNRAHLQKEMNRWLQDTGPDGPSDRPGDRPGDRQGLAVMILDLDGFKDVNDTLGHQQGDVVLVEVAHRLGAAIGEDGFVARLGGDEFAVLVPQLTDVRVAQTLADRVQSALQEPIGLQDLHVEVGASIGISLSPEHGRDPSMLLKRADMAMYDAKSSGMGIHVYQPRVDTNTARRLSMVSELRAAIQDGQIEVYVQPQAESSTGHIGSVEALARWNHPALGMVSPEEFVPVAERSGLIRPLTLAVLDASLAGAVHWQEAEVAVAVNLSARSLLDPGLVRDVEGLLWKHDIPPHLLTLEVTESAVMADPHRAISLLRQLNTMGVRLSVDDFGTGYSSLSYLKRLPVQEVKIDRSFVTELTVNSEDFAIVRSIVDLGTNLGLEIVAEGVEDQPTQDLLRSIGCTRLQGWHIGHPMPTAQRLIARFRPFRPDSFTTLAMTEEGVSMQARGAEQRARTPEPRPGAAGAAGDLSRAVMDAAPYLVVVSELRTGAVVRLNRLASQVTGLSEDQVRGRPLWETVLGPGDRAALEAAVAAPGGALGHDSTLRDASGQERRVMWTISFLDDGHGRRDHLVLTGVDVTPASGSCGLLSHVMRDAVAAALVGTDAAGRVTFCNPAAEAMLGYPAALLLGRPLPASILTRSELEERAAKLGVPADLRVLAADLSRLDRRRRDVRLGALDRRGRREGTAQDRGVRQHRPRSYDWTLVRADGSPFTAAIAVTTLSDAAGRPTGYLASAEDVTEQRRSRNLLLAGLEREVEAVRRLEALDRAKTDFVATVSHELRTPITNISGYAELLLGGHGGTLSGTQATMLDAIQRSGARLGVLADNLLTLSSFEAGEFALVPEDVDLRAVVQDAESAVRPLIADRRIDTTFVVPEQPVVVSGDARHLTRVVLNLLTNALKFTEDDGMVACSLGTEAGQAVLRVSDTGIGIPEEEQDRLFTNFFRSSTAQARAIQGIGLGLSVVDTIVRRHGGEISVVSGHLRGSTFTVRLPLAGASVRGEAWPAREGAA